MKEREYEAIADPESVMQSNTSHAHRRSETFTKSNKIMADMKRLLQYSNGTFAPTNNERFPTRTISNEHI